jgi:hypothetical protein
MLTPFSRVHVYDAVGLSSADLRHSGAEHGLQGGETHRHQMNSAMV